MLRRMSDETGQAARSSGFTGLALPDPGVAASWILGFGLVLFLAVSRGGFDLAVFGQTGIAAWLILLLGAALGLLPSTRPNRKAWWGFALLGTLTVWAAIGLLWTDTPDKTLVEVARFSTYLAIFALAIAGRSRESTSQLVNAIAWAIAAIALLALLSRYFPGLFARAGETGAVLHTEAPRLSFPLDYWNGLGALLALGLPLLVQTATATRRLSVRAIAAGCLPLLLLALYLTLSRGSLLAAAAALLAFHLLARRAETLMVSATGLIGGVILIFLSDAFPGFSAGLTDPTAHREGRWMLLFSALISVASGAFVWARSRYPARVRLPVRPRPDRRVALAGGLALALAVLVGLFAVGAPGRVSDAWESFKAPETPSSGTSRLGATSGNGRYQLWSAGLREFRSAPAAGRGGGSFEYWWAERGDRDGFVRDAHSLYIQSLGEYGLIGFLLLAGFFLLVLYRGVRNSFLSEEQRSNWVAAATAGTFAFSLSATLDWVWQIPAIVAAFLLLAATILNHPQESEDPTMKAASSGSDPGETTALIGRLRAAVARERTRSGQRLILSLVAIAGIALAIVPVSAQLLINQSQSQVRSGNLPAALDSAEAAHAVSPTTAAPLIQAAGVLDLAGEYEDAIGIAQQAITKEPVNWRNWYVLSRIEADAGKAEAARASLRRARNLNPRSPLFQP